MNNLTNYHSHCDFCDGHAPMELFVREAVKEGFSSYGVSSHAPFPVQNGCNMQKEKMTAYLEEFRRLKQLYSSEIDLYIGLEIDFLDDSFNPFLSIIVSGLYTISLRPTVRLSIQMDHRNDFGTMWIRISMEMLKR